ncbi:hypothetical protein GCM10009840_32450 [Pseudolysinimonas kribbensis]|uniref:DUF4180 domain-containing protein n=1 Tax=Pseudolysinimonas kribbensis TaxID=433641 RepID=A0ABQ6JZA3_9MICO|nr:DUF4180 domain-containing protein [Pseudolysinimonas kribbensis]GMA93344.1 hypothetical protein GCM10025881_01680 [Pseudolysinimonas kribbensis]
MILRLELDGPLLRTADDAMDLIATTFVPGGAETIVVPVARLDPDFFRLSSGVAGEVAQKFANYRRRLVILGDVSVYVARSDAFRDWVREVNRGRDLLFVADDAELRERVE